MSALASVVEHRQKNVEKIAKLGKALKFSREVLILKSQMRNDKFLGELIFPQNFKEYIKMESRKNLEEKAPHSHHYDKSKSMPDDMIETDKTEDRK